MQQKKDPSESLTIRDATRLVLTGILSALVGLLAYVYELFAGEAVFNSETFVGLTVAAVMAIGSGWHFWQRRYHTWMPLADAEPHPLDGFAGRGGFVRVSLLLGVLVAAFLLSGFAHACAPASSVSPDGTTTSKAEAYGECVGLNTVGICLPSGVHAVAEAPSLDGLQAAGLTTTECLLASAGRCLRVFFPTAGKADGAEVRAARAVEHVSLGCVAEASVCGMDRSCIATHVASCAGG